MLPADPRLLLAKTAWSHYQAQVDFWRLSRERGHKSIVLSHHIWDRALKTACETHQRQRHSALNPSLQNRLDEGDALFLELQSWTTAVGCIAHDIHNSLTWSVFSYINDREAVKHAWIVIQSLRNGFNTLATEMGSWISVSIDCKDHPCEEHLREFWLMMGLTSEWAEFSR